MVRESMFDHVPIPEENIHGVNTSYPTASEATFDYRKRLQAFYGSEHIQPDKPIFDYTLMGMGDDGHTASLFPGTEVLNETEKWCDAVCGVKAEDRITLTYPVLNASRVMLFLVASKSKREVLGKILDGDTTYPAARVKPWGSLIWLVDQDAAPEKSQILRVLFLFYDRIPRNVPQDAIVLYCAYVLRPGPERRAENFLFELLID